MSVSGNILKIDSLLDQLDAFAADKPSQVAFWSRWLEQLCKVSATQGASLILHVDQVPAMAVDAVLMSVGTAVETKIDSLTILEAVHYRLAARLHFGDTQTEYWTGPTREQIIESFAEVARRFVHQFDTERTSAQRAVNDLQLLACNSGQLVSIEVLVLEHLCQALKASQISMVTHSGGETRWAGTTGLHTEKHKTTAIRNIEARAEAFRRSTEWLEISQLTDDLHDIAIKLPQRVDPDNASTEELRTIIVQWTDADSMMSAVDSLLQLIPFIQQFEQSRVTSRSQKSPFAIISTYHSHRKKVWFAGCVLLLIGTVWLTKDIKTPHRVAANGLLVPVNQRIVYSNSVGFVDAVYIEHESKVDTGRPLLQLRSSAVEMQLEEIEGELAAVHQQRAGLRLSLNQLKTGSMENQNVVFQISSEIASLDAKSIGLTKQKTLLQDEIATYKLLSPIVGTVVTRDLQQNLVAKPVTLGEPLLRICDTEGPWIIEIEVDIRDIAAVQNAIAADRRETNAEPPSGLPVAFRLTSEPEHIYQGNLTEIDTVVSLSSLPDLATNTTGSGNKQIVRAQVTFDKSQLPRPQIDASVIAKIDCGNDFWWRNWTRHLVDAMRRRFWIDV